MRLNSRAQLAALQNSYNSDGLSPSMGASSRSVVAAHDTGHHVTSDHTSAISSRLHLSKFPNSFPPPRAAPQPSLILRPANPLISRSNLHRTPRCVHRAAPLVNSALPTLPVPSPAAAPHSDSAAPAGYLRAVASSTASARVAEVATLCSDASAGGLTETDARAAGTRLGDGHL
jgi:hypothetical protein